MELAIEYLSVDALKPYEKNARLHGSVDVDAIAASIKEFGFKDPIGIWGKDNTIVEGHGRLMAAKKLGMTQVPCIRLDDLTDEQRRAYALAHNKTAENSAWDDETLIAELDSILDIDMEAFGFDVATEPMDYEVDAGDVDDKTNNPVCVKIVFENAQKWRSKEAEVREFVGRMDNVSVVVGEYEDNEG